MPCPARPRVTVACGASLGTRDRRRSLREYASPALTDVPPRHPHRRPGPQRGGAPGRVPISRRTGRPLARRDRRGVPRRRSRPSRRARRLGRRPRRPGRAAVADPLRVDAARLRHLVRRRGHGAGLRDLVRRPGRPHPHPLRRPRRRGGERRPRRPGPGRRGSPAGLGARRRRRGDADGRGRDGRRRRDRRTTRGAVRREPGHDHLHLRHHRTAQGLHAHARQLPARARRGRRGARRAVRRRGRRHALVPAARPRVRPDHPGRRRAPPRAPGLLPRHPHAQRRPRVVPPDVPARGPAGVREDLQLGQPAGRRRRTRQAASTRRPTSRSPGAGRSRTGVRAGSCAPGTRWPTGWSTPSSGPRSAGGAATRSPAAPRSASGSVTSTGASA